MTGRQEPAKDGGRGHPLPDSAEAREDQIPEHLVREKGHGDDAAAPSDPAPQRTAPDGESYDAEGEGR